MLYVKCDQFHFVITISILMYNDHLCLLFWNNDCISDLFLCDFIDIMVPPPGFFSVNSKLD